MRVGGRAAAGPSTAGNLVATAEATAVQTVASRAAATTAPIDPEARTAGRRPARSCHQTTATVAASAVTTEAAAAAAAAAVTTAAAKAAKAAAAALTGARAKALVRGLASSVHDGWGAGGGAGADPR